MADEILTPGKPGTSGCDSIETVESPNYLIKDNYFSEFESELDKEIARENLGVYDKSTVYTKIESDNNLKKHVSDQMREHLIQEDPHQIMPKVDELIRDLVRPDGTTPFIAPQTGVDPIQDFHLVTKRFVAKLLRDHINDLDPHQILPQVEDMLEQYVKQSEVYFKCQLYTKHEIDKQSEQYIKKDGTTPFIKAQIGADPQIDSHLATKRYVDKVIYDHLVEVDPHGFISILNQRLAAYAKVSNVYDKSQTYSRVQIDGIIRSLVHDAALEAIQDHLNEFDPHNILAEVRKERYIKQDGSIPFRAPQKGMDAVDPQDLVTLHQVEEKIAETKEAIDNLPEPIWITSGPVESTVGHVEDNTPVPETMTFQEIMDAIFYGKGICLEVPDYVIITETCPVTMCIHGSTGLIQYAELYQNGELIYTLEGKDFENGCVTVDSLPLFDDAEFTFKVFYTNGSMHEVTEIVKCYMPVFVGLLPKWKFGTVVTMDYLIELCKEDTEGTQNRFLNYGKDLTSFTFKYQFQDPKLRHPFVVLPADYPDLDTMVTKSQSFGIEAFDVIDMIPFQVPGVEKDIVFKMYIYRQALSSLNQEVTFNFKPKE